MKQIVIASAVVMLLSVTAEAKHHRHHHHHRPPLKSDPMCGMFMSCPGPRGETAFYAYSKPSHYISGRLVCARNVNEALRERGIKGTGSALAHSFDRWGRASPPVPGAVAISSRRGGGHVAIVSRVVDGKVMVWNATGHHHGWYETTAHAGAHYRVAG